MVQTKVRQIDHTVRHVSWELILTFQEQKLSKFRQFWKFRTKFSKSNNCCYDPCLQSNQWMQKWCRRHSSLPSHSMTWKVPAESVRALKCRFRFYVYNTRHWQIDLFIIFGPAWLHCKKDPSSQAHRVNIYQRYTQYLLGFMFLLFFCYPWT